MLEIHRSSFTGVLKWNILCSKDFKFCPRCHTLPTFPPLCFLPSLLFNYILYKLYIRYFFLSLVFLIWIVSSKRERNFVYFVFFSVPIPWPMPSSAYLIIKLLNGWINDYMGCSQIGLLCLLAFFSVSNPVLWPSRWCLIPSDMLIIYKHSIIFFCFPNNDEEVTVTRKWKIVPVFSSSSISYMTSKFLKVFWKGCFS